MTQCFQPTFIVAKIRTEPAAIAARKPPIKITVAHVEKVQKLLPAYKKKEITRKDLSQETGLSESSICEIIKNLRSGKDPAAITARKPPIKITVAHVEKVQKLLPAYKKKEITRKDLLQETGLSESSIKEIINDLGSGKDSSAIAARKPPIKITVAHVEKVQKLLPAYKKKEITRKDLSQETGLSESSICEIIKNLRSGKDPAAITARKPPIKITVAHVEKVQKLLPAYKKKEIPQRVLMQETGLSISSITRIINGLKAGKDPAAITARKPKTKVSAGIIKKNKKQLPDSGKLESSAGAADLAPPTPRVPVTVL